MNGNHDKQHTNLAARRLQNIHAVLAEVTSSPWSHDALELVLATAITPGLAELDESPQVWLLLVAPPSSDKTVVVQHLKNVPFVLYVDSLTENALASGYRERDPLNRADCGKATPDLLKLIESKGIRCVLIKDLTTLFSLKDDKVKKILGELQSIFDGEFVKATGTVGLLRYQTRFALMACLTPHALERHHRYMAQIGSRFLTYRMRVLTEREKRHGFDMVWDSKERKARLEQLAQLIEGYLAATASIPVSLSDESPEQRAIIEQLATFMARGRGAILYRKTDWRDREIESVQVEGEFRALQQLRTLARALARIHGRRSPNDHDIELLRRVALGSLPTDRAEVLDAFRNHPEGMTATICSDEIKKSVDRSRELLEELVRLNLLSSTPSDTTNKGRPPEIFFPVEPFADLITKPIAALDHMLDLEPEINRANSSQDREGETDLADPGKRSGRNLGREL